MSQSIQILYEVFQAAGPVVATAVKTMNPVKKFMPDQSPSPDYLKTLLLIALIQIVFNDRLGILLDTVGQFVKEKLFSPPALPPMKKVTAIAGTTIRFPKVSQLYSMIDISTIYDIKPIPPAIWIPPEIMPPKNATEDIDTSIFVAGGQEPVRPDHLGPISPHKIIKPHFWGENVASSFPETIKETEIGLGVTPKIKLMLPSSIRGYKKPVEEEGEDTSSRWGFLFPMFLLIGALFSFNHEKNITRYKIKLKDLTKKHEFIIKDKNGKETKVVLENLEQIIKNFKEGNSHVV